MARRYDIDEWERYCSDDDEGADPDDLEGFHRLGPKGGGVFPVDGAVRMTLSMVLDIVETRSRRREGLRTALRIFQEQSDNREQ